MYVSFQILLVSLDLVCQPRVYKRAEAVCIYIQPIYSLYIQAISRIKELVQPPAYMYTGYVYIYIYRLRVYESSYVYIACMHIQAV